MPEVVCGADWLKIAHLGGILTLTAPPNGSEEHSDHRRSPVRDARVDGGVSRRVLARGMAGHTARL